MSNIYGITDEELQSKRDDLAKRNVVDYYKYWTTEAVKADLDEKRNNFSVLCTNIQGDLNLGQIIRCGNAFLAKEIIIYGKKKWDRRAAVGTQHYTNFRHVRVDDDLASIVSEFDSVIGVDNIDGALPINSHNWDADKNTLICFGEENSGLPQELIALCDDIVYIRQHGSVRSLNVGAASAIVMYEITRRL